MAPLSAEEENYVRLALLLKGVSPRAVRTYFDREFPPTHLPSTLTKNYNTLFDLKFNRVLNQVQWNLLFPRNACCCYKCTSVPGSTTSNGIGVSDCISVDITRVRDSTTSDVTDVPDSNTFDGKDIPADISFGVSDKPTSNPFGVTDATYSYNVDAGLFDLITFDVIGVTDSTTFDVTLMICLIRHLTSVKQPINGFDRLPLPVETTPGPDLARIKWYRNNLAHHDSNNIDTAYFNTAWIDISLAVSRLGGQPMNQECQDLKVKILDQSNQEIMLEIKHSQEEMKELKQIMDILETEHTEVTENLKELQDSYSTLKTEHSKVIDVMAHLKDQIPWNMRGTLYSLRQEGYIITKDIFFVITASLNYEWAKGDYSTWLNLERIFDTYY
ncbi:unnamed protein product [Mytilus edulis]|uniref:DZIP3-like HEPN domain-containing protein n=1 Tax=Mytilus edulis TaxID=6550 RepID=A0A8S3R4Z9_MYTED|nr:unnamed protein product [Mytilus edulis]